jgi:hypothetical protein
MRLVCVILSGEHRERWSTLQVAAGRSVKGRICRAIGYVAIAVHGLKLLCKRLWPSPSEGAAERCSVLTLCRKAAGALRLLVGTSATVLGFAREKK